MSIQEIFQKFKRFLTDSESFLAMLLTLVAVASFGLGRMSVWPTATNEDNVRPEESRISIHYTEAAPRETTASVATQSGEGGETGYVASKNGTKYHLPWCSGAQQINDANKIRFATKEEAEAAGYTPAANCKGI